MKQKIALISIVIILIIAFTFLGTNFAYAAENEVESTNMIFEKVENKDQIKLSMKINENEGIASFQTSLQLKSSNLKDIKNITINWSTNISSHAVSKTINYDQNSGILSLYVVSKTELTEIDDKGNILLKIGTICLETENDSEMNIQMIAGKTVFSDIAYQRKEIQANPNNEKIEFTIAAKNTTENPENPDDPNKPNNPDNPSNPNEPNNPNTPNDPNKPDEGETQTPTTPNDKPSNDGTEVKDGKYNGIIPFTGLLTDYKVLFATLVILMMIAIIIIVKKYKDKFTKK